MPAKAVQISIDSDLLRQIDALPKTKKEGRSALVREALEAYLALYRRASVDRALIAAFSGQSEAMEQEIAPLLDSQAWPDK